MAIPILDRIVSNLLDVLGGVTAEGGGYSTTLLVKEPDHVADAVYDGLCLVNEGDWEYEDPSPVGMDGYLQQFDIDIHVRGGDETNFRRLARLCASDARVAVMLDESRGGYARWTKVTGARHWPPGELRGITVNVLVNFRTLLNRPDRQQ